MNQSSSQCEPELLQRSLDDVLNEQQEERLSTHLNECVECRNLLEAFAGGRDDWSKIESALRNEISVELAADDARRSRLIPADGRTANQTANDFRLPSTDFAVEFLQPSNNPESIGRLDDIEIRAVIGQGGNGIVLKGFQAELNRLVAVKVMAPMLATSAAARKRFAREAQATAAIVHPNVMPILTVHSDGQLPYLIMPYVDCESLQDRLDHEAALPTLDVLRIAHQVANGLAAAHAQGLVHRDVKPANILLEKGVDRVMLTDFGLARAVDDATLTRTGLIAGTPQYMSPEQARGDGVDTRSDLFSLGSVMYAMSTGRPPFRAETSYGILRRVTDQQPRAIVELNSEIPQWLQGLIEKLLAKSPTDRFTSAVVVADTLEECVAHVQQPSANPLPTAVRALGNHRPWPRRVMCIATFALLMVLLLFSGDWFAADPSHANSEPSAASHQPADDSTTTQTPVQPENDSFDWNDEISDSLKSLDNETNLLMQQLDSDL